MTIKPEQAKHAAENAVNRHIKGDLSRDYPESARTVYTMSLQSGVEACSEILMDFAPWIQHTPGCMAVQILPPGHDRNCDCGLHAKLGIEP